jgi:hypothetical protein
LDFSKAVFEKVLVGTISDSFNLEKNARNRCTQADWAHILILRSNRPLWRNGLGEWLLWSAGAQRIAFIGRRFVGC